MAEHHLTQAEAAERLAVSPPQISRWLARAALPSPATAKRIATTLGVPLDALAAAPDATPPVLAAADVVLIPRTGTAGAGSLGVPTDGEPDADPYPATELRRFTGLNPQLFRSTVVVGDSNLPILRPGDHVIYDPRERVTDHGLYVLDLDGDRIVKFVQRLAGGVLALIPENTRYRTETLTPVRDADEPDTYRSDLSGHTARVVVVGKVVWYPPLA